MFISVALLLACAGLAGASAASEAEYRRRLENGRMLIRKVWSGEVEGRLWQATDLLTPAAAINSAWLLDLCPDRETMAARLNTSLYKYLFITDLGGEDHAFAEILQSAPGTWSLRMACRRSNQRLSPAQSQAIEQAITVLNQASSEGLELVAAEAEEVEGPVSVQLPPSASPPLEGPRFWALPDPDDALLDDLESMEAEEVVVLPSGSEEEADLDVIESDVIESEVTGTWPWDLPEDEDSAEDVDEGVRLDTELEMGENAPIVTEIPLDVEE